MCEGVAELLGKRRSRTRVADAPEEDDLAAPALLVLHVTENSEECREREGHARAACDEDDGVVCIQIRGEPVRPVDKDLDLLALRRVLSETLREALPDVDEEHEFFPVDSRVRVRDRRLGALAERGGSLLLCVELVARVDRGDCERVGLKREGGDRGHDEVRSLTGGPLEVRGTLNV